MQAWQKRNKRKQAREIETRKIMKLRIKYNAPVVLTFALLSGLVLAASCIFGDGFLSTFFVTYRGSLLDPLTYLRMFTYVLGHASLEHYVGNMMLFLLLGPGIEEKYGTKNTLLIIVITALSTAVINMIFTTSGLIGASGIVFAFIVLSSMTSFQKGEIPLTLILILVLYIGQEIMAGLFTSDNISQSAHIIGGLIGASFGFFFKYHKH